MRLPQKIKLLNNNLKTVVNNNLYSVVNNNLYRVTNNNLKTDIVTIENNQLNFANFKNIFCLKVILYLLRKIFNFFCKNFNLKKKIY